MGSDKIKYYEQKYNTVCRNMTNSLRQKQEKKEEQRQKLEYILYGEEKSDSDNDLSASV